MVRPERFELPTNRFEADYSIQLSYGRLISGYTTWLKLFYPRKKKAFAFDAPKLLFSVD